MATYKVWLTVKDSYGNTKEVDGGTIDVALSQLATPEIEKIEQALTMQDYLKKEEVDVELDRYATDEEVTAVVQRNDTLQYSDFTLLDE